MPAMPNKTYLDGSLKTNTSSSETHAEHCLWSHKNFVLTRKECHAVHTLADSEETSITDVQTSDMTLADCACSDKEPCLEDNDEGPSKVKRARLENSDEVLVLDCDMETTIESAIANAIADLDLRYLIRKKVRKRLPDIDKLECEYVDVDIAFDRIERDLKKLQHEGEKLEQAALLATPEVHFEDDFTKADTDFKVQETPSSEKAPTPADVI